MDSFNQGEKIRNTVSLMLSHYEKNKRSFPWRGTHDPYRILVSEYMLQQTQADRVVPKYSSFLKKFPTIQSLAQANRKNVLALWSGLGYNRRAVALHSASKAIAGTYGGTIPRTKEELLALPGVGEYTANAILAFAYNKPVIVIETNIRTIVLHHCIQKKKDVKDSTIHVFVERLLREMMRRGIPPRVCYSAMMDYGTHLKAKGVRVNNRSRQYTKQSRFDGSVRQARGILLRFFITASKGVSEKSLQNLNTQHIDKGLAGLIADGLIEKRRGRYYLAK